MFGYEIAYASNVWLATGLSYSTTSNVYKIELRYSTDGSNWAKSDLSSNELFPGINSLPPSPPLPIGSISFDGTYWNVFVHRPASPEPLTEIYRHDTTSSFASGWVEPGGGSISFAQEFQNTTSTRFLSLSPPVYVKNGPGDITIDLTFPSITSGGPTITSPTILSYLLYQYVEIAPIQLSATGTGQVYFFVSTADLPPGLAFDPLTNQIYGTPAQIGKTATIIRAKDDIGVTEFVINFTSIIPRIIRKQDGAGAYTSLLRQYTNVLGAQNARDSRVLPNQTLGEFMSPDAPDVITSTIGCDC